MSAKTTVEKAINENNPDYLKGEFKVAELMYENNITKEQADSLAKSVVPNSNLIEEQPSHYSYNGENYILQVSKKDGTVIYRRYGYDKKEGQLDTQKLDSLKEQGKALLKEKGFEDTVLLEWQYSGGEISMIFYPIKDDTVYYNCPLGVVLMEEDGSILGLNLPVFKETKVEDDEELMNTIKNLQSNYSYIVKAVDISDKPCYCVLYERENGDYITFFDMATDKQTGLYKLEYDNFGMLKKPLAC